MTVLQGKRRSIQSRLVLLLLCTLIPVLAIQAYMYYDNFQFRRASELQANLEIARAVAKTFESFIQDVVHQELQIGVAITSSRPMTSKDITRLLTTYMDNPAILDFTWANPDGYFAFSSNPVMVGHNNSDRAYFRDIVNGREWTVGELERTTGKPVFGISRGIRDEKGTLLGVVVATVIPEKLDAALSLERSKGGGLALVDKKGMLVYRYPAINTTWEERNWLKQYPEFQEVLKGKEIATTVYAPYEGKKRVVGFTPVPSIGWAATAGKREEEVIGPILTSIAKNAILFLCVSIAAFLIALAVSRKIASPVTALRDHALALGRGEERGQAKISHVLEFQDLAEAFNAMAEKVRGREMALRESEQRWATTLASIGDAVIATDKEGRMTFMNAVAEKLTGWNFGESTQQKVPTVFHIINEHTRQTVEDPVAKVLRLGKIVGLANHTILVKKDRTEVPIDDSGAPIVDKNGKVAGVVLVFRDISERKRAEEEMRKAHDRAAWLARFPEENPNPVMRVSGDGSLLYCNPAAAELPGWPCEVGQDLGNILLPLLRRAMTEEQEIEEDFIIGEAYYSVSVSPFPEEQYANIYGRDITQRKQAQQALLESEARANLLSTTAGKLLATDNPQAIVNELCRDVLAHVDCQAFFNFLVDENMGRLYLNAWAGIPEEEARKIEWLDYGVAVCGCAARDASRIVAEHIPTTPDVRNEFAKSYGIKAYACHPLLGPGRKVIGTLSFGTRTRETFSEGDLSLMKAVTDQVAVAMERMRLIGELKKSRDELEKRVQERTVQVKNQAELIELSHDAIFVRDLESRIIFWSKGAEEVYGWTGKEALGNVTHTFLKTDPPVLFAELAAALIEKGRWEGELIHARKDGKRITILSRQALQRNEAGVPSAILEINIDITERKRLEQQLRQAQKMEAIGTLTGGIAHDLNNILAPIVINSELALLDSVGNSELHNHLDLILKSGLRGKDLVRHLLLFSRKSEKKQEFVSLAPVVKETFKLLRSSIPSTIQMKLHLETDSDAVYADLSQIQQVIMNLCTNAAYAMRGTTGSIDISLQGITFGSHDLPEPDMEAGEYLVLSVKDTGCGMDEEVRKRIFEPFFTTKPTGEGTGLGLSVVYGIVKNHRGNITVYSELGKGSIFKVYLPKVETEASEKGEVIKPIPKGDEHILFVDDEEFIVNSIRNMLQHLGYKVTAFLDSREALRLFSANPSQFDLVLTDQTMPFMTGEDLGKEIIRLRPDIPVILCTGYADFISWEKVKEMGFHGFIMKPFTVREGAELVRRILDEKGGVL